MSLEETLRRMWKEQDRSYAITHYTKTKARALKFGIPFDLTVEYLTDLFGEAECNGCPALGIEMKRSSGQGGNPNTPSIDRAFPNKGYTMDNIAVISLRANHIKRDATLDELQKIVRYIENYSSNINEF